MPLRIKLEGTDNSDMTRLDVIRYIERVENKLMDHPDVGYLLTPNSFIKRMDQVLNAGEKDTLPDNLSRELVAQYYLLYDNSGSQDIRDVVDNNYRHGVIVALLSTDKVSTVKSIIDEVKSIPLPEGFALRLGSHAALVMAASNEIVYGQISSLIISSVVILLTMSVLFKNLLVAMIAVLPLASTLLVNFSVMRYASIDLDIATAIVSGLVFGIGIDYAIHFIESVKRQYRAGAGDRESIYASVRDVAQPVMVNSLTLAAGFAVLTISSFSPLVHLGFLVSMTMLVSAFFTLLVMPLAFSCLPMKWLSFAQRVP